MFYFGGTAIRLILYVLGFILIPVLLFIVIGLIFSAINLPWIGFFVWAIGSMVAYAFFVALVNRYFPG